MTGIAKIDDANGYAFTLEEMLDKWGMVRLQEAIKDICHLKAEHLRSNWQDEASGRDWDRVGLEVGKLVSRLIRMA